MHTHIYKYLLKDVHMSENAPADATQSTPGSSILYLGENVNLATIISFQTYSYNPRATATGLADAIAGTPLDIFGFISGATNFKEGTHLVMPLPKQLVDNIAIQAQGKELGITGSFAADVVSTMKAKTENQIVEGLRDAYNQVKDVGSSAAAMLSGGSGGFDTLGFLARSGLGSIDNRIQDGIGAALANTVNQHQTLTFDGVSLKQHTFNFEFAPETPQQSDNLRRAIRQLKKHSLPSFQGITENLGSENFASRGLLTYPSLMKIAFHGIDDDYFFKFKPALLSNVTVDYTPHGNSLLRGQGGGRPAFINIGLTFVEQAIWTQADYADSVTSSGEGSER